MGAEKNMTLTDRRAGGHRFAEFVFCDDCECFAGANDGRHAPVGDEVD